MCIPLYEWWTDEDRHTFGILRSLVLEEAIKLTVRRVEGAVAGEGILSLPLLS